MGTLSGQSGLCGLCGLSGPSGMFGLSSLFGMDCMSVLFATTPISRINAQVASLLSLLVRTLMNLRHSFPDITYYDLLESRGVW